MRKSIKKDLLEIIEQLKKVNEMLQKKAGALSQEQVLPVLTECQQSVFEAGNRIEEDEGEGTPTVKLLEQYCEEIYSLCVSWGDAYTTGKGMRRIEGLLHKISDSIRYDLPDSKMEVAFLPYKASMWDSLESIWMAARDDENCDAYVIPIPYFDKNPDGGFGEMHYEGDLYPDYVPITMYDTYDFQKRHPDIIYIHNPYDEWNYVTSVHPFFYSENLIKYTDKLVYIPYYVTGGTINETQRLLPSYYNVDNIVVQHERQIAFFAPEISEKIRALGSPKFDKVINLKVKEDMIPDEWKPKLRDTVLFLNTGIAGILKSNEKSLLKIQYLMEVAETENVTLLWRPHPLLEATILSMRPELWQLYLETVEKFQKLQNGILDRTENAELAIKISDAYLGEPTSSISHLFGVLGKPLFFIRHSILKEDKNVENVKISCCTMDPAEKHTLWALAANRNGLMKISEAGKIEEFYIIPDEADKGNLYRDILIEERKLYLIPGNAKEIAIFDINSKQFVKLMLDNPKQKEKFNKGYVYKGNIYMIPRLYPEMVVLSCADEKLYYNKYIVNELKELTGIADILVSANGSRMYGDSIWLAAPKNPYLLEYNVNTQKTKVYKIPGTECGFCCIERVGDKIILGSMEGCELIVWDQLHNTSEVIRQFPKGWNTKEEICFWNIVELQGDAYIFPRKNQMVLKLSLADLTLAPLKEDFPFSIENRQGSFYNHPDHFLMVKKLLNGKVIVQDANRHGLSEFSEDGTFAWKAVALTEEDELKALGQSFARQGDNLPWGIYETKHYSVRRLIAYVRKKMHDSGKQKDAFSYSAANLDGTAGQKIYAFTTGLLQEKTHVRQGERK